jgi:hypothetical protein
MIKNSFLIAFGLMSISICSFVFAADSEVTLDTTDSNSGFTVKDSDGNSVFRAGGDGNVELGGTAGVDGIKFPDGTTQTTAAGAGNQMLFFGNSSSSSTLLYIGPNGSHNMQEGNVQFALPTAGTITSVKIKVKTNTYTSGFISVILRKNGGNTSLYKDIYPGETGVFDAVGVPVPYNANDLISLQINSTSANGGGHQLNASMLYSFD